MNKLVLSEELRTLIMRSVSDYDDRRMEFPPLACWEMLRCCGSRLWLDTGDIEQASTLWNPAFEALTTNNTLLNHEIQKGIYDRLILNAGKLIKEVEPEIDEPTAVLETAFVLNALHGLRLTQRFGGMVSVELHTALADDVERSVAYGIRFHEISPQKFIIKIPFSPAGLIAAGKLKRMGIPVNFTLGFSARQNYLAALFAEPAFVNVFMGRLNAFVADNKLGSGNNVGEKATLATQRQLLLLRHSGQSSTCLIGASIRDRLQVEAMAGIDVMTIPPKAAHEFVADFDNRIKSELHADLNADCGDHVWFDLLWNVNDDFSVAVFKLRQLPVSLIIPSGVVDLFHSAGLGNLFPRWSAKDLATIKQDGKIPVYDKWRKRLEDGSIGIDALMTAAAFQAFCKDQDSLDDRIRQQLGWSGV